ncbi:MarR family transcriptional regulator [Arthrobacter sp. C9C5]|uniref:MarR family winged helix-turn-helix transcriptional regulator n=1 Tax=Arthrobacter sp. C9C5 TaxID=2735267 RepID=UPI001585326C|nr:MarR family transcriptional regulator [Arthrobacter sp. C9C5]NUU33350.1 MarR family transcriptional regulator [Arthrobacter sp. C9C5]
MPDVDRWSTVRLLLTAARLVEHAGNENLASVGLTHAGLIALQVLEADGTMTQTRVAAKVRVQAQTMGKTLARLEENGHVTRVRSQRDSRSLEVGISGLGKTTLDRARELEQNLAPGDKTELKELRDWLVTIIRLLGSSRWGQAGPEPIRKATNDTLSDES